MSLGFKRLKVRERASVNKVPSLRPLVLLVRVVLNENLRKEEVKILAVAA